MPFHFNQLVDQYYQNIYEDDYPRLMGWEFLWDHVQSHENWSDLVEQKNINTTALHLGFYLANWGMFRGSSELLNTNLDFIKDFCAHIFNEIPVEFWDLTFSDFDPDCIVQHQISSKLYDEAMSQMESFEPKRIAWTETLKSKILLGLWGNCPALDTFYLKGVALFLKENSRLTIKPKGKINSKSLSCLNVVCREESWRLDGYVTYYGENLYPPGKIIDMAFFQYGMNNAN